MGIGYLLQGLQQGFAQGRERARMAEMENAKLDYMKAETTALKNKLKADEIKQGMQKGLFDQLLKGFMGGGGGAAMPTAPQSYSDLFSQGQEQPQMSTNEAPAPPGAVGAQTPSSLPELMADLERQGYENPMMAEMLKENLGMDFGELKPRSVAGKSGQPVTQFFTPFGRPFGQEYPEAVKPEAIKTIDAQGREVTQWVNPYQQGRGQSAPQGGGSMVTKPPEVETITFESGGTTYEQDINKVTRQPMGAARVKQEIKAPSAEAAGKIELAKTGIKEFENLRSSILGKGGDINRGVLAEGINIPGIGGGVPFTKGRNVRQSFERTIDAVIRAATGAAVTKEELANYSNAYFPSPLDTDEGVRNKMIALEEFLNGYLETLDPTKNIRVRGSKASSIRKPSLNLKPGSKKKDDPLGLR